MQTGRTNRTPLLLLLLLPLLLLLLLLILLRPLLPLLLLLLLLQLQQQQQLLLLLLRHITCLASNHPADHRRRSLRQLLEDAQLPHPPESILHLTTNAGGGSK